MNRLRAGWVHDAGDVPGVREHKPYVSTGQPRAGVRATPRRNVILFRGEEVQILINFFKIKSLPCQFHDAAGEFVPYIATA